MSQIQESIKMVKLTKPTVYNTKVKTAHGTASIVEDRYNFTNKKVYKEDLDKAVLKELKQKLKDDRTMIFIVRSRNVNLG